MARLPVSYTSVDWSDTTTPFSRAARIRLGVSVGLQAMVGWAAPVALAVQQPLEQQRGRLLPARMSRPAEQLDTTLALSSSASLQPVL
jgi:hypothetical protein